MASKFIPSSKGYREVMKSAPMRHLCHSKAEEIAAEAAGTLSPDTFVREPYAVKDFVGSSRAGSSVFTNNDHAMYAELKRGTLQSAAGA